MVRYQEDGVEEPLDLNGAEHAYEWEDPSDDDGQVGQGVLGFGSFFNRIPSVLQSIKKTEERKEIPRVLSLMSV
jgi:hypothetical protein